MPLLKKPLKWGAGISFLVLTLNLGSYNSEKILIRSFPLKLKIESFHIQVYLLNKMDF